MSIAGRTTTVLELYVVAYATTSGNIVYSYDDIAPCPESLSPCAACADYADCPREFRVPKVHVRDTKLNRTAFVDDGEEVRPWSNELPDFSTTGGRGFPQANEDLGVPPQQSTPQHSRTP